MRAVVQRVEDCSVSVAGTRVGHIDSGLLVYLGVESDDSDEDVRYLADKVVHLRIFPDEGGKMNRSMVDTGAGLLVVSQFTLHADVRKGRRPSYNRAAPPDRAERYYSDFLGELERRGVTPQHGQFGAHMAVRYTNDGPVTILIDTKKSF